MQTIQRLGTRSVPLVIMTYFNPLVPIWAQNFFRDVEGTAVRVIIPDLPHEHADLVEPLLVDKDIALVPLIEPNHRNRAPEEIDP